jgi:putative lipoic acid-binding regulatory protein
VINELQHHAGELSFENLDSMADSGNWLSATVTIDTSMFQQVLICYKRNIVAQPLFSINQSLKNWHKI